MEEEKSEKMPHWLNAPADLKKKSFEVMDENSRKLGRKEDSRKHIDWNTVNSAVTGWWAENGYSYP